MSQFSQQPMQAQQQTPTMQMHQQPMQSHDLQFDVSHNGVVQPQQQPGAMGAGGGNAGMTGAMDGMNMNFGSSSSAVGEIMNRLLSCGRLAESSHPLVCVLHMLFKALALFFYMFGGWFAHSSDKRVTGANFITIAVICILLLAADFWVVKNVTGRLLVGLRWWNKVDGDTTQWIFESHDEHQQQQQGADGSIGAVGSRYSAFDKTVFWWVLYITPLLWLD